MSIFSENDIIDDDSVFDTIILNNYKKYEKTLHNYIQEIKGNIYYNYYASDENTDDIIWKFGYEKYKKIEDYNVNNETLNYVESLNYSIILPVNFIIKSPIIPRYIDINRHKEMEKYYSQFTNSYNSKLYLYSPRTMEENSKYSEYIIKNNDIDLLFGFDIQKDLSITDIVFRGSFDTFDTYYKFINECKNKFPNTHIWFNYETKVINDKVKLTKNYILTYLNSSRMDPDKILDNGNIKISYSSFPNDGFLTNGKGNNNNKK